MDITQEEILKKYEELPEDLKTAMYSASTAEIIYEIGKKHGLNIEETGDLTTEVAKILLGLNHPKNFISTLADVFDLPKEKATEIAQDVNHQIFFPIREELKKLHGIETSSELTPSAQNELPQRKSVSPRPEESVAAKSIDIFQSSQPKTRETAELVKGGATTLHEPEKPQMEEKKKPSFVKATEGKDENIPRKQGTEDKYREPID